MRRYPTLAWLLFCLPLCAQSPESQQLEHARKDAEQVRKLVEAGALPRNALDEADLVLQEARDEAILGRTLYGSVTIEELTEEQTAEMLVAAQRLVDRQQREWEQARQLVEEGAAPRKSLTSYEEELDRRRQTLEIANRRAELFRELAEMVKAEEALYLSLEKTPEESWKIAERYDGSGVFLPSQLSVIRLAFEREFSRPLPISALGATALHRALGFDHRGRVDVALHPDQPEGKWLRQLLEQLQVPYFAFRSYVPGASTGAHIHIGPPSGRLHRTD